MVNLGLIGNIYQMKPYIEKAYELPEINVAGKSAAGTQSETENYRLPVPEFSRIELIKSVDALFINRFSSLSFRMLSEIIRESKPFFATSYPNLSPEECAQLSKLAREAKTVIQVANPYFYLPPVQWFNQNIKKPAYIDLFLSKKEEEKFEDLLIQLLLMLKEMTDSKPKKINAIFFEMKQENELFRNINLEYGDGSIVNLNIKYSANQEEFTIKTYARNQFAAFDMINAAGTCNNSVVNLDDSTEHNEVFVFFDAISGSKTQTTNLDDYSAAIQTVKTILTRIEKYTH